MNLKMGIEGVMSVKTTWNLRKHSIRGTCMAAKKEAWQKNDENEEKFK
jgi:hypothetical protein